MPRSILLVVVAVLVSVSPTTHAADHTKDTLETVKKRVGENEAVLVDVRELAEWKKGHLARAELIPLSTLTSKEGLEAAVQKLPKGKPIYLHCKSGGRCVAASEFLEQHGLDVRPLKPGFVDLVKAGFEKAKEE